MRNQILLEDIRILRDAARKNDARIWDRVAELLERPRSKRAEVNLAKIARYATEGSVIVVPGKVLGVGSLNAKVTIGAYSFSESALNKILASNSKALTIRELVKMYPKGSGVRIIV
jgi:large subunit ribosomal protein L18e